MIYLTACLNGSMEGMEIIRFVWACQQTAWLLKQVSGLEQRRVDMLDMFQTICTSKLQGKFS